MKSFTVGQADHSPLAMPCPLPRSSLNVSYELLQLLILSSGKSDNDIGFAGSQGEDVDAGARTHWAEGCGERGSGVPVSLSCQHLTSTKIMDREFTSPVSFL